MLPSGPLMSGCDPTVSVVIPTHQRRNLLGRTLAPLLADPDLHELVVVCDGCSDGSAEMVTTLARADERVRLVQTQGCGAAGARLTGAEAATGELLLLLDDDVVAGRGLLQGHAAGHRGAERLVLVGYMPLAGAKRQPGGYPRDLYGREYERHCDRWETGAQEVLHTLWAGNMSVRRADFLLLAGQKKIAPGYHEDLDLGLRLHKLGLHGRFDRRLAATHYYSRSPEAFIRDALSSGAMLPQLHEAHSNEMGPLHDEFAQRGLSWPARRLIAAGATQSWPRSALVLALPLLGSLRLYPIERYAGALLRRLLQQQAARANAGQRAHISTRQ